MACTLRTLFYISLLLAAALTRAEPAAAGIGLSDSCPLACRSQFLNGAGARSGSFVDVFFGALCPGRLGECPADPNLKQGLPGQN
jgi:hypothetical protein